MQNGSLLPTPALDLQSLVCAPARHHQRQRRARPAWAGVSSWIQQPGSPGFHTLYTYDSELIPAATSPTYIAPNGAAQNYKNVINEFKLSLSDPNVIDPASRREVISFGKNASNHNGGTIAFGHDGYLYLGTATAETLTTSARAISNRGQCPKPKYPAGQNAATRPLKPPEPGQSEPDQQQRTVPHPYRQPVSGAGQVPEIYAYGLRNPTASLSTG
jgi:glucose/arabinose dehydrogenase